MRIGFLKAMGRKPRKKITWPSKLGVAVGLTTLLCKTTIVVNISMKKAGLLSHSNLVLIDGVEEDMKIRGWRRLVDDRGEWKKITEKAKTHPGSDAKK